MRHNQCLGATHRTPGRVPWHVARASFETAMTSPLVTPSVAWCELFSLVTPTARIQGFDGIPRMKVSGDGALVSGAPERYQG